ncbi:aminoglycoside phosphotransferase family protein [Actinokineospora sp. NBRC 105648]|uniref:phosphotransferase family protein n=1 Tax=Actinokineospora sp. NBRC 105648 TaxID=3032206 RepID=UPI0025540840|nr:aminoglycoside phosphotransferase family protein [Actinokineospora sp. NBRC 105648]
MDALTEALRVVAPGLAGLRVVLPELVGRDEPQWRASSAAVGDEFVAKFAWSAPAARRLAHEISVLSTLAGDARIPFVPEVVACGTEPVLLVTRRVPGMSLFAVVDSVDRDHAGRQLARFLVALHDPGTRACVEQATGTLPTPRATATTEQIRARFSRWVRPDQRHTVADWCDWADELLATPCPPALVHGDLHGDNQVWREDRLCLVVDYETVSAAEPEYDFRALPATGPDCELLTATVRHYERLSSRALSVERIMAWHLRTTLDDALWRSEAGVPLPDHRTPAAWVDDLATRFATLGIRFSPS